MRKIRFYLFALFLFTVACHVEGQEQEWTLDNKQEQILSFWFGELTTADKWDEEKAQTWFNVSETLDQEIRETFGEDVLKAAAGDYSDWEMAPRGRLALIILLDQFTRNIFRGTPRVYEFDHIARKLTLDGVSLGFDLELYPIERQFFYLPLMHSEDLDLQESSLKLFHALKESSDHSYFADVETYAKSHAKTIKTFGRFPHRNALLNRENTPAETKHLEDSTATYGQSST